MHRRARRQVGITGLDDVRGNKPCYDEGSPTTGNATMGDNDFVL